jgi:translocation and assembly module TamB
MKALRITLIAVAATLVVALALVGALWTWSGTSTSLATSLNQLMRFLPADQSLEVKDVKGSLRGGGTIGWLRWKRGDLSVEASEVSLPWAIRTLLDRELRLGQIKVRHLRIDDRRAPTAPAPPTSLILPIKVDAPFSVDTIDWVGPPALLITGASGHYIFDSKEHSLSDGRARISSGNYQFTVRLQSQAPMALTAQLDGSLETTVPSSGQKFTIKAHADVKGAIAAQDAILEVNAQLVPELVNATGKKAAPQQAMQADVSARIQPWQKQPVAKANGSWKALDLAALWPQAPQTLLAGEAAVTPDGASWRADVKLNNTLSGPWDKQRLPVDNLMAKVVFTDSQWNVESLQAKGAGGRIEAQGQLTSTDSPRHWQGSAKVHSINPAALDSRLAATALDGQVTAQQTTSGIAFDAHLQAAPGQPAVQKTDSASTRALAGLRVKTMDAKGLWQAPKLTLDTLNVRTDDAQLQGKLTFDTESQAAQGQLDLNMPGGKASVGGQMSSAQGRGDLSLQLTDAALATRWLERLPGLAGSLGTSTLQGTADLTAHWQGGWQKQGQELQIQAGLRAPKLDLNNINQPADAGWRLRDLQADLAGNLRALTLSTRGQAESGTRRFNLQAQARGGRVNDGIWQARVDTAQLTAQDSLRPGLWTLQLNNTVSLDWKQSALSRTLDVSAATARLVGPVPGATTLSWQAARWSQQGTRSDWRTQGSIQGLPLAWLDLVGQTQMANLGLRGDLLFGGQWDASGGDTLRLRATLERTSGDLQVQTEGSNVGPIVAGVREARVSITADGDQLAANLRWDSERAGQAQAAISTRLQRQAASWTWPADAPLSGTLEAKLPPVGVWSLLAPPGWRLRGTLDTQATLSGTRSAPQWRGKLQAQDLAIRSVAEGIDFSNGTLSASLEGQRLDIQQFTLQGAGGSSGGGLLSAKGSVVWLPATATPSTLASRLRMELDATLQALRLSARADRRLVMSGKLTAQLSDARLNIRGSLKADEALFILPDDTAPQLGDDVVVRRPKTTTTPVTTPVATGVRVTPDVAVTLDLGQNFQVRGRGLISRLAGSLELRTTPGRDLTPRLTGQLQAVGGTYKAYGQQLDIEEGVLRFNGPFDNPSLDILAIRPNLQQRVGVQISGTALSPIVRLYAEPDLPDADKLAWLVLGRSSANGGAESALLQQAALALLGGNGKGLSGGLAEALGLDELSVRGADNSNTTGATVTLGKRVSRNFYVAYERSLAGTLGTFYIFYDLSRRFTLRAQTGEQSAVDLIFTLRYDTLGK